MLSTLKDRFGQNPQRHADITWDEVEAALNQHLDALTSLMAMEESGGEPDVIGKDPNTGNILICDCSPEAPAKRRSLCYDDEALRKRKKNPPKGSACTQAAQMDVLLMNEDEYYRLQELGEFDLKTSTWIATPPQIRDRGGALFCEKRYGRTFTFHNGADSYYAARGWRGILRLPA